MTRLAIPAVPCAMVCVTAALACALGACTSPSLRARVAPWPEADALFRGDARFLGADSAYSVPLPGDRVLWLFGDTFVATSDARVRSQSRLVRNSLAVMQGRDPARAAGDGGIAWFFGGDVEGGAPDAFFLVDGAPTGEAPDAPWLWPGTPVALPPAPDAEDDDGALLLFLWEMRPGGGLGFTYARDRAVLVENPADDPPAWRSLAVEVPENDFGVALGTGGALVHDGFVWLLATKEPGLHEMVLARVPVDDARAGELAGITWLTDAGDFAPLDTPPRTLFFGQTELSLGLAPVGDGVVAFHVEGFGQAPLAMRTAPALGARGFAFSDAEVIFTPPESAREGALVYSAKAHPELFDDASGVTAGTAPPAIVTYCSNHTDFATLVADDSLYFPRFVRVTLEPR